MTLKIVYSDDGAAGIAASVLHGLFFFGMLLFGIYGGRRFLQQLKQDSVHQKFINFMFITGVLAFLFLLIACVAL